MQLTGIPFNQSAQSSLTALINVSNQQVFLPTQLSYANPAIGVTPTDTKVVITPTAVTNLVGNVTFEYQRLDISTYFEGAQPTLYISGSVTPQSILDALLTQYLIYFGAIGSLDTQNLCDVAIDTVNPLLAVLTPNPNHLVWVGKLSIAVDQRSTLSTLITTTALPGFSLPANLSVVCPNAELVYGLINGQNFVTECQLLHSGDSFNQYLPTWQLGTELTTQPWYANPTPGAYNVYGSSVLYNGPAVGPWTIETPTGTLPGNVLVIQLGTACTNLCGMLIINYTPV